MIHPLEAAVFVGLHAETGSLLAADASDEVAGTTTTSTPRTPLAKGDAI